MIVRKIQNYLWKSLDARLWGFIFSLMLSALWFNYHQPINVDGMLYLQAAQKFSDEGIKACMAVYSWPFYSILIALFSSVTSFSLVTSAYLLTSLLISLIIVNFITIVKDLGGDKATQYIACFVILMFPTLAHERYDLFRDFGYYAFGLLSAHYLLRYQHNAKLQVAILWGLASGIATLFRIEGLVFQILMPFLLFFSHQVTGGEKILLVIKAQSINILLSAAILLIYLAYGTHFDWGRLNALLSHDTLHKITDNFVNYLSIIKTNFNVYIAQDAKTILISGMIGIVLKNLLIALTPIYAFLCYYGINLVPWQKDQKLIMFGFIILNILILFGFVWVEFFLVNRYAIYFSLFLLLFVPFTVREVIARWQRNKNLLAEKIRISCVMLSLVFLAINSIFLLGADKSYIIEAGNWIQSHTDANAKLYTTEIKLIYYSARPGTRYPDDFPYGIGVNLFTIKNVDFKNYDYAAISVTHRYIPEALSIFKKLNLTIIKNFTNNRGDVIYILKTA